MPKAKHFEPIRLNKYLARTGIASRRKADELIRQGRVSIDGQVISELGYTLQTKPRSVEVDEVSVDLAAKKRDYYAFYKPKNVVTTMSDPEGRPCVGDYIKQLDKHLFPVGRLDFDAEGLLILTNDGDLAHRLSHPRFEVEKLYQVKIKGKPSPATIEKLKRGVKLEDGFIKPTYVKVVKSLKENTWVDIKVTEGRNHLIKRIWQRLDHFVLKLVRTEFAGITTKNLVPGQTRKLQPGEIQKISKTAEG